MKKLMIVIAVVAVALTVVKLPARAADAGQFTEVTTQSRVQRADGKTVYATVGTLVGEGDLVQTDKTGKATILLKDGSVLRLGPSTNLRINKLQYDEDKGVADAAYSLASGAAMFVVGSIFGRDDSNFEVKTPTAVSGVRGTIGILRVSTDPATGQPLTTAISLENTVFLRDNNGNLVNLSPGEFVNVGMDGFAQAPARMPERDLEALIELVMPESTSLDGRASGLRFSWGGQAPKGIWGAGNPPDFLFGSQGGGDGNPPDGGFDNPADMIFQEPPQATELIIKIDIAPSP